MLISVRSAAPLILVVLAGAAPLPSPGQVVAPRNQGGLPPSFRVDRWSSEDGLPGQAVEDVARHEDGFLWLVASGLLVRFDGTGFRPYRPDDHPGLPGARLTSVAAGPADTVWTVSVDGHMVRGTDGRFEVLARVDEPLHDVARGPDGDVWVRSTRSVWILEGDGLRRLADLEHWGISRDYGDLRPQTVVDEAGAWIRSGEVVVRLDRGGSELRREDAYQEVLVLGTGREVLFLRAVDDSTKELRDPEGRLRAAMPRTPGRVRLVDGRGRVWNADESRVEIFLPGRREAYRVMELGSGIGQMMRDVEGNVWVTTASEGLVRILEVPFTTVGQDDGIERSQVFRVSRGREGSVLAIDRAHNAYRIRDGRVEGGLEYRVGPEGVGPEIGAMVEDVRGTLWMTWGGGTVPPTHWLEGLREGAPPLRVPTGAGVDQILADPDDPETLWVAVTAAVAMPPPVSTGDPCRDAGGSCLLRVRPYDPGGPAVDSYLPGVVLRHLAPDGRGGVWLVADTGVVHVSPAGSVTVFDGEGTLPDVELRAVHLDAAGTVWIGTYGSGLLRLRSGRFEAVRAADGLGEDVVSTILEDGAGNLWMGGNESIHRVRRSQVEAFLEGRVRRVDGVAYGRRSGLLNPEGSGWAAARAEDGTLWFPTFGGAAAVDPVRALALDARAPRVVVEEVRWGDGMRGTGSEIRLDRGARALEIDFTATSLRDPAGLRFEHRLEGTDEGSVDAGAQRTVRYTNVPAGTHAFRVRARSAGGVWSASDAEVTLAVPPFFHETPWFWLLLASATLTVGTVAIRFREGQARARAAALERQVQERTRELEAERRTTEEALEIVRAQAEQLRSLDEAKSRFFANVTHELRTPLTLLLGPLDDLATGRRGTLSESADREIGLIRSNAQRLFQLVDQLLDIARLEADELPLRPTRGDATRLLERVCRGFESHARSRDVAFRAELPPGPVPGVFDPDCLEKVVTNLLGNAFKFTPAGGSVGLRADVGDGSEGGRELVVSVEDTGRGIAPEELERVFERFHRTDERHPDAVHGSGVGLALVRELVDLQGGAIDVVSAPDEGSAFTVRIPLGPAKPADDEAERPPAASGIGGPLDQPVALFVEDHPDLRRWVRGHLEPRYRVVEASNGREGLELAHSLVPDVVVSDVMMPEMDGEELCRALKTDPDLDFVPVILVTARSSRADRLSGLRHGADAYLSKPFDVEELLLTIENVVATRRNLRERIASGTLPAVRPAWEEHSLGEPERRFLDHLYRRLAEHVADEDLGVEALAEAMGMSRSTLYRRIDEHLGEPAMEVIWSFRLEQAATWLRETDVPVSEIAYGVGFKSVSHFARRFKNRFGESPSTYREKQETG